VKRRRGEEERGKKKRNKKQEKLNYRTAGLRDRSDTVPRSGSKTV
jgi:hypothetical protein